MKRSSGRILSFLFLLLFIYPLVEKELHAFQHSDDFHCASATAHFHTPEVKCSFCDVFIQEITDASDDQPAYLAPAPTLFTFSTLSPQLTSHNHFYTSLRAPPFTV
jgi:hypothetical protein